MVREQPGLGSLTAANRAWNWEWTPPSSSHFKHEDRSFMVGLSFHHAKLDLRVNCSSPCMRSLTPPRCVGLNASGHNVQVPLYQMYRMTKQFPFRHTLVQKSTGLEPWRSKFLGAFRMPCRQTFAGIKSYHVLDWYCCFG